MHVCTHTYTHFLALPAERTYNDTPVAKNKPDLGL